jgi:hypothetical protein
LDLFACGAAAQNSATGLQLKTGATVIVGSSSVTNRANNVAGYSCPITASMLQRLLAHGWTGTMSPYPVVVSVAKLK